MRIPRLRLDYPVMWLVAALLLLPLMVTGESLWIDEAQTAVYATLGSFQDFVGKLASDNQTGNLSEGLMPLSMFLAWIFGRGFEVTEWSLRLPNLIYLAVGLVFLWRSGVALGMNYLVLWFAVHPFVWYYANEARPYALQLALGCVLLWSCVEIIRAHGDSRSGWIGFFVSGFCLCASSLLCLIPVSAVGISLLFVILRNRWGIRRHTVVIAALFLPLFVALGAFYLDAMHSPSGSRAWQFGAGNLAYAAYEILGFQGLGPGRTELREAAKGGTSLWHLFSSYLVPLAALAIGWLAVAAAGLRVPAARRETHLLWCLSVLILTLLGFISLGVVMNYPFWGRHLAPLLPFLVCLAAACCHNSTNQTAGVITAIVMGLLWAASAATLCLNPRFAKDDYRSAASFAKYTAASGGQTWWAADTHGANFYGLYPTPLADHPDPATPAKPGTPITASCHSIINASMDDLEALPEPKWIVLSKPDIYDNSGDLMRFLKDRGYQIQTSFTAFDVWTR